MARAAEFVEAMLVFVQWSMRTLDPEFLTEILGDRSLEDASRELFGDLVNQVRGNRGDDVTLATADFGLIMDHVAATHLKIRHGPDVVSIP